MDETLVRASPRETAPAAGWTLLCVDDERNILSALRRLFRASGWRVLAAESALEALELLGCERVDVVISDMRMPGMDGAQLLEQVAERWPGVVRLLLTGHADVKAITAAVNRGQIWRYVNKPWDDDDLMNAVQRAFERCALERDKERLEALTREQNEALRRLNASLEERVQARTAELTQAHERLKKNYVASIRMFSNLIELRGGHLVGHSRRVAETARLIAQALHLPEADVQDIFIAGLLHDVGQVGLPDALLAKPVPRMSKEEFAQYCKHPLVGEQTLLALDDMQAVAQILRSHHERWDGKGFPDGCSGDAIPLGARVLAVADTYDDLQSGHIVAGALSSEQARMLMTRGRGVQFDPQVLDVFLGLEEIPRRIVPSADRATRAVMTGQLEAGQVLAQELRSPDGVVLLAADHVLTPDLIERIRRYERREALNLVMQVVAA